MGKVVNSKIAAFVLESNAIEGIHREPTSAEIDVTEAFLRWPLDAESVCTVQGVYAPGMPLRDTLGMNVRVGRYIAPNGGPEIRGKLAAVLTVHANAYRMHVAFELLHPFLDGNGRTGRAIWAHRMLTTGQDPFALSFLHRFYYQTLEHAAP